MRIAVIADIHGNRPALNAVLSDARANGAERFILAGDYIFDSPWSNEVTETIRALENTVAVQGNKEEYLPGFLSADRTEWIYQQLGAMYQTIRELKPENAAYLSGLPQSATVKTPSGRTIYCTHWFPGFIAEGKCPAISSRMFREAARDPAYTREDFLRGVGEFLRQDHVADALSGIGADAVVFGHTHLQWHGYAGGKLILNPGSAGQPLDGDNRAAYTLLTDTPDGIQVAERRAAYDVEAVIGEARQMEVCRQGMVWSELVFATMRSGYDTFGQFFALAEKLAGERGQSGSLYENDVWNRAFEQYKEQLCSHS